MSLFDHPDYESPLLAHLRTYSDDDLESALRGVEFAIAQFEHEARLLRKALDRTSAAGDTQP